MLRLMGPPASYWVASATRCCRVWQQAGRVCDVSITSSASSSPPRRPARRRQALPDHPAHRPQHGIACGVTVAVVDLLEVVQVDQQ